MIICYIKLIVIILVNLNPFKLVSEFDCTAMEIDKNALQDAKFKQRQEDMVTTMSTELDKLFDNNNSFQKMAFSNYSQNSYPRMDKIASNGTKLRNHQQIR